MNNILEIPEVSQRVSRLSVADYHQMSEFNENHKRTELIRGVLIEKMSKSPLHSHLESGQYGQKAVYSRDQILTCTPLPSASIDLADLFAAPKADT